jgi:histidyl-tRNA synthetase
MSGTATAAQAATFLKKASGIALHYGFSPVETVVANHGIAPIKIPRAPGLFSPHVHPDTFGRELSALIKPYAGYPQKSLQLPLLFYHSSSAPVGIRSARARFGLTVAGVDKSIAESLVLKTALSILSEMGAKDFSIHVNSMGDRDSLSRFSRETQGFLRKNINDLPIQAREAFKRDIFHAIDHLHRKNHPLRESLPRTMEFLSESSRRHLKEVLEFLELEEVPYQVNSSLIGHKDFYSQTIFEIRAAETEESPETRVMARGGRCDDLARRLLRYSLPTVGILLEWESGETSVPRSRTIEPKVYFIQIGNGARLRGLSVIESMRKARIPMAHSLNDDTLTIQLQRAASLTPTYIIIMGQREAIDGTVIVRNVSTQGQETVPVAILPIYFKQHLVV